MMRESCVCSLSHHPSINVNNNVSVYVSKCVKEVIKMLLEIITIIKRNHIGVSIIAGFNGKSRVANNITRKKMA